MRYLLAALMPMCSIGCSSGEFSYGQLVYIKSGFWRGCRGQIEKVAWTGCCIGSSDFYEVKAVCYKQRAAGAEWGLAFEKEEHTVNVSGDDMMVSMFDSHSP